MPVLRLIIDNSAKEGVEPNSVPIWNPEDNLCGRLQLVSSSKDNPVLEKIAVYFEGVSRNWMRDESAASGIFKAERKFISQVQDISLTDVSRKPSKAEIMILETPFHFIISRMIAYFDPDSPELCLHLPPSLELGEQTVDLSTGLRFAQPSTSYYLRAEATFKSAGSDDIKSLEAALPIIITPHTEELPPTETNDFPSEFNEQESKVLKRIILGATMGTLHIGLSEPPPLSYGNDCASSNTDAVLKLSFMSTGSKPNILDFLSGLKFTVYSLVRVKTFYSVKSFPGPPGQDSLDTQKETRLRDDVVKLETRTVSNASWGYRFDLGGPPGTSPHSVTTERPSIDEVSSLESKSPNSNGKWISNWTIPIQVDGRLLPTFCSAMVARYYSFIVRIKVSGVRREVFDLEVPLQVVHTSPNAANPGSENFLRQRRESEILWFGDEALETEAEPPRYYK